MIGEVGAALAAFAPIRPKHEVVDDQLASASEQVAEGRFAFGSIEHVVLLDLDPGEGPPLRTQLIASPGERLLFGKMRLPCRDPFVLGYDLVLHHRAPSGTRARSDVPRAANSSPQAVAGVIQPTTAPPGSRRMAIRPMPGISNSGRMSEAPAAAALFARSSTWSTERYGIQLSRISANSGPFISKIPPTILSPTLATQYVPPSCIGIGSKVQPMMSP